ncbi:hypothetical protein E3P98_01769 [Wallemia ichthyophaga]|nr:hypothetical protein E3P98_01769 [Wallemia ichthyophaga]
MEIGRAKPLYRSRSVRKPQSSSALQTTTLEDVALAMNVTIPEKSTSTRNYDNLDEMAPEIVKEQFIQVDNQKSHFESELSLSTAIAYQLFQQNDKLKQDQSKLLDQIDDFNKLISYHLNLNNDDFVVQKRHLSVALESQVEKSQSVAWIESQANELKIELSTLQKQITHQNLKAKRELRDLKNERDLLKTSLISAETRFQQLEIQLSLACKRKPLSNLRQEWRSSNDQESLCNSPVQFPQVINDSPLAHRRTYNSTHSSYSYSSRASSPQHEPLVLQLTNTPKLSSPSASASETFVQKRPYRSPSRTIKHARSFSDSAFMMGGSTQQKKLTLERELAMAKSLNERTKIVFQSVESFTTYVLKIPSCLSITQAIISINITVTFAILSTTLRAMAKLLLYMYLALVLLLFLLRSQMKAMRSLSH